jgi:hypothetical protein
MAKDQTKMYKLVDGNRVLLGSEEMQAVKAEWTQNTVDRAAEKQALDDKRLIRESGLAKLEALGLTEDELLQLFGD